MAVGFYGIASTVSSDWPTTVPSRTEFNVYLNLDEDWTGDPPIPNHGDSVTCLAAAKVTEHRIDPDVVPDISVASQVDIQFGYSGVTILQIPGLSISLWALGSEIGSAVSISAAGTNLTGQVTFSGLSLTQAQLDDISARFTSQNSAGAPPPDTPEIE